LIVGIVGLRCFQSSAKHTNKFALLTFHSFKRTHRAPAPVLGFSPRHLAHFHAQNEIAPSANSRKGAPPFGRLYCGQTPQPVAL